MSPLLKLKKKNATAMYSILHSHVHVLHYMDYTIVERIVYRSNKKEQQNIFWVYMYIYFITAFNNGL